MTCKLRGLMLLQMCMVNDFIDVLQTGFLEYLDEIRCFTNLRVCGCDCLGGGWAIVACMRYFNPLEKYLKSRRINFF